jgi:hypothetical protein
VRGEIGQNKQANRWIKINQLINQSINRPSDVMTVSSTDLEHGHGQAQREESVQADDRVEEEERG